MSCPHSESPPTPNCMSKLATTLKYQSIAYFTNLWAFFWALYLNTFNARRLQKLSHLLLPPIPHHLPHLHRPPSVRPCVGSAEPSHLTQMKRKTRRRVIPLKSPVPFEVATPPGESQRLWFSGWAEGVKPKMCDSEGHVWLFGGVFFCRFLFFYSSVVNCQG